MVFTMPDWVQNGQQQHYRDADSLTINWNGEATVAEIRQILSIESQIQAQYGYVLNLNLVHPSANLGAEVRRIVAEEIRNHGIRLQVAVVGATLVTRTVATLVIRCARLISKQPLELEFFASEPQANQWLEERRRILQTEAFE